MQGVEFLKLRRRATPVALALLTPMAVLAAVGHGGTADARLNPGYCANVQVGTGSPDILVGTIGGDLLRAYGSPDELIGRAGADCLFGDNGADTLRGGDGIDRVSGGPGADLLQAGFARDVVVGGPGGDTIHVRDKFRQRDTVICEGGRDDVSADLADRIARSCEQVDRYR